MISASPAVTAEIREARREGNLLGTEGSGWDTGYAVRWLAGPESRWITGAIVPVDAGVLATVNLSVPKKGWQNRLL